MNPKRSPLKSEGAILAQRQWRQKLQAAFLQRNKAGRLASIHRLRQSPSYQAGAELFYTGFTAEQIDRLLAEDDDAAAVDLIDADLQLYEASCQDIQMDTSIDITQTHVLCPVCQRDNVHDLGPIFACPCTLRIPKSAEIGDLHQLRRHLSVQLESHPWPCRPRFRTDKYGGLILACDHCQLLQVQAVPE